MRHFVHWNFFLVAQARHECEMTFYAWWNSLDSHNTTHEMWKGGCESSRQLKFFIKKLAYLLRNLQEYSMKPLLFDWLMKFEKWSPLLTILSFKYFFNSINFTINQNCTVPFIPVFPLTSIFIFCYKNIHLILFIEKFFPFQNQKIAALEK